MSSLEQLPADQSAVLNLLIAQKKSYAEIAATLDLSESAVSERAYAALTALAEPEKAPASRRRAEISDYLLGQQDDALAEKTKTSLMRSASDRAWARAAAVSLASIASGPLPGIPGAASEGAGPAADGFGGPPSGPPVTTDQPRERGDRGGTAVIAGVALIVALGAGFALGRVTGGSDSSSTAAAPAASSSSSNAASTTATPVAQASLKPPVGAPAPKAIGVAEISQQGANRVLSVVAKTLPSAPAGSQYGVWLTSNGKAPVWLGYFQAIGKGGGVALQGTLNGDPKAYSGVLVTRESTAAAPTNPSATYLVGPLRFSAG